MASKEMAPEAPFGHPAADKEAAVTPDAQAVCRAVRCRYDADTGI